MVTYTTGKTGYAVMTGGAYFIGGQGVVWQPEEAMVFSSHASAAALARTTGGIVVRLVGTKAWVRVGQSVADHYQKATSKPAKGRTGRKVALATV